MRERLREGIAVDFQVSSMQSRSCTAFLNFDC